MRSLILSAVLLHSSLITTSTLAQDLDVIAASTSHFDCSAVCLPVVTLTGLCRGRPGRGRDFGGIRSSVVDSEDPVAGDDEFAFEEDIFDDDDLDVGVDGEDPANPLILADVGTPVDAGADSVEPLAPVEGTPTDEAQVDGVPPVDGAPPVDEASVDGANGAPVDGAPVDGAPVDGAPVDGAPDNGSPVDGVQVDGAPVDGAQAGNTTTDGAPAEQSAIANDQSAAPPVDSAVQQPDSVPVEGGIPSDQAASSESAPTESAIPDPAAVAKRHLQRRRRLRGNRRLLQRANFNSCRSNRCISERGCVCTNRSFDVQNFGALCASCLKQKGNNIRAEFVMDRIMRTCSFTSTVFVPSATTTLTSRITITASVPSAPARTTTRPPQTTATRGPQQPAPAPPAPASTSQQQPPRQSAPSSSSSSASSSASRPAAPSPPPSAPLSVPPAQGPTTSTLRPSRISPANAFQSEEPQTSSLSSGSESGSGSVQRALPPPTDGQSRPTGANGRNPTPATPTFLQSPTPGGNSSQIFLLQTANAAIRREAAGGIVAFAIALLGFL